VKNQIKTKHSYPGSWTSGWLISRLFFRVTLGRKRIIWIAFLMLVPLGLAVYWRIAENGTGLIFFEEMTVNVFLQFFAVGLPLYLGVSAIRDEIDDKTIVYLFARPLHRSVVVGGKIISVALVVAFSLVVVLALVFAVLVSADGVEGLGGGLFRFLRAAGVLALAAFAYTVLFSLAGVILKRPMVLAMIVGVGWELTVSNLSGPFPKLTLMYYFKSMLGIEPTAGGMMDLLMSPISQASLVDALAITSVVTVVLFGAALYIGSHKEYRV